MKLKATILFSAMSVFSVLNAQESRYKPAADNWISQHANELGILPSSKMLLQKTRVGNTGETLRYQQYLNGVPIYQSEIVLHYNKENAISFSETESIKKIANIDTNPTIAKEDAYTTAFAASKSKGDVTYSENKLYVFHLEDGSTKLAYRVLIKSYDNPGSWETIVDAKTGDVISVKDVANYHHHSKKNNGGEEPKATTKKVGGTAYVFDPDPLSYTQSAYAGQYVDNNDATNASLDAARKLVNIPELELAAGVYKLKSQYVEIAQIETPTTGLFTQATPNFLFNRNEQGFEAANVFWHVDQNMRYINEVLGVDCVSMWNNGVIQFDPHGLDGDDNSYYSSGQLVFGEGCIDDAEDADVVIHELGHGVHDWLTNGSLSQVQGLSEGSGDYWAQSYSRSLNQWPTSAPAYNWVFSWDGHNACWAGRSTAYTGTYPGSASGSIHTAGQIWATSLMRIYNKIGKQKTDRIFLEGLSRTTSSSNQQVAARAARQAALDMVGQFGFTCADVATITQEFTTTGYSLLAYTCTDLAVSESKSLTVSLFPNPANDKINVMSNTSKQQTIEIYGMDGKKVKEATISGAEKSVDVSNLIKGIYILKIKGTEVSQKFIKN